MTKERWWLKKDKTMPSRYFAIDKNWWEWGKIQLKWHFLPLEMTLRWVVSLYFTYRHFNMTQKMLQYSELCAVIAKAKKNVERWINCNQDITMPDRTTPTKITQSRKFIERTGWKEFKIMTWIQWWYLFFEDLPFIAVISSNRGSILNKIDHRQLHDFKNNKQNVSSVGTSYLSRPIRKIVLFIIKSTSYSYIKSIKTYTK